MSKQQYWVVFLMFLCVFVNYMDRVNFSVSIPAIRHQFGFSLEQIGAILFVWGIVYAIFNFPGGWIVDRIGLRWGMVLTLGWWSIFTAITPLARGLGGWYAIRGLMGAGEAPIWALNAKSAGTYAESHQRSTHFTWAGSGQYLGPAIGTFLAGWILVKFGWQWTFAAFGIAGLLILPFWVAVVRDGSSRHERAKPDWSGIRAVFFSRTGIGMFLVYLTFGYILFTFLYWMPSYMYYTFHMGVLKSSAWASLGGLLGFAGFIISGPFNDRLVARYDRLTARRIGAAAPMFCAAVCVVFSLLTARAQMAGTTATLIGVAQLLMNMTVGAWAVNVVDISPNQASTGFVYGVYNGVLNVMGAFNSLIVTWLAGRFGFPAAFGSAIVFMLLFLVGILFVVDRTSYSRLLERAQSTTHLRPVAAAAGALAILLAVLCVAPASAQTDTQLQTRLRSSIAGYEGKVALYATDLKSGKTVAIDANTPVPTASVIKLTVLFAALKQIEEGAAHFEDPVVLTKANQVEGSGILNVFDVPQTLTFKDALTLMIDLSDNTATNLAIDHLGLANIDARIQSMGLHDTWLYKKVFMPPTPPVPADQPRFGLGKTTAREMASVMQRFATCDLDTGGAPAAPRARQQQLCDAALFMLKNQQDRDGIPRYLGNVTVANKTGALNQVRNDVGIVYAKNGPIIISAFTYDNKDQSWTSDNSAQLLIARLAKTIVDSWQ
jgi:beta-lactamase class A/sugar phosphate permease